MKKRLVSLTIATTLLVTGCSSNSETTTGTSTKGDTTAEAEFPVITDTSTPSWTQNKDPYTLTWFVAYDWYGKKFDPVLNIADKKLLEETGITLDIQVGNTEKLNLLISTGELPDIITFDAVAPQRMILENGGMLLPLEPLEDLYAPDLNVPESMKDWYRNDDGNWYSVASYYYGPERSNPEFGGYYVTHNNNYARTDILEQIGFTLEDMQTKDGFYEVVKYIKDNNVQYDGKTMTPFVGVNPEALVYQFGVDVEDKDGNLNNLRRQPEYLETLLFYNQMYRDGIITDEEFTRDASQRDELIASGNAFSITGWAAVNYPRRSLYSYDPNARLMYAGQIQGGDNGQSPILDAVASAGWTSTVITKNAKRPDKAIQFMSYMTEEINTLSSTYGWDTYDIVDGVVKIKPEVEAEYAENYEAAVSKYEIGIEFFRDWNIILKYSGLDEDALYYEVDHYKQEHDENAVIIDNKTFAFVEPTEGEELTIKNNIDQYWTQALPRIIMSATEEEAIKEYNNAITEMDNLGMQKLDEYKNTRFKQNKEKLGIDFVWPRNL